MENNSEFSQLTLEQKRDHIRRLFSPMVQNLEDWRKFLEIFVLSASDEKLNSFYNACVYWDKEYVNKLINDIKSKKWEIKKLQTEYAIETMKYKEAKEKHTTEQEIDQQLWNI